jgi:hypothetical protein
MPNLSRATDSGIQIGNCCRCARFFKAHITHHTSHHTTRRTGNTTTTCSLCPRLKLASPPQLDPPTRSSVCRQLDKESSDKDKSVQPHKIIRFSPPPPSCQQEKKALTQHFQQEGTPKNYSTHCYSSKATLAQQFHCQNVRNLSHIHFQPSGTHLYLSGLPNCELSILSQGVTKYYYNNFRSAAILVCAIISKTECRRTWLSNSVPIARWIIAIDTLLKAKNLYGRLFFPAVSFSRCRLQ